MKSKTHYKISASRRAFIVANYIFCGLVAVLCVMPVLHVMAVSFSSKLAVFSGNVYLWPKEFTFDAYTFVMSDSQFFKSYMVTIERSALGWAVNMLLMVLAAYPLSLTKQTFPAKTFFTWYFLVTILFNGGIVPSYLVVNGTGLLDTIWALVLPGAVPVWNLILMINFMRGLPDSLYEAAYIDGAGHTTTLFRIILPLCKPSIACLSLFCILNHWNAYFDGMIYIRDMALKPLQTYLRSIVIVDPSASDVIKDVESLANNLTPDSTNGAKIFLALFPIMCVYPFLQKHFAQGIIRGSVKE